MRGRVALVLAVGLAACAARDAQAAELRDPCGPFGGAIVENWARPPTPAEQARVEELRRACRADAYPDLQGLSPQRQLERLEELYR
jgi:hypothetical protein